MLFTGPLEHRHLVHLLPLADVAVVPSIFPEAFGMVAAEAAACGCPPLVARHSGLAEVAAGLEEGYPSTCGTSPRSRPATWPTCGRSSRELLALSAADREALAGRRPRDRRGTLVVGECRRAPARAGRVAFRAVGEEQRLSADEQLATARAAFEGGTDFTLAVEEEFALLDPETLDARRPLRGAPGGRRGEPSSRSTSSAS